MDDVPLWCVTTLDIIKIIEGSEEMKVIKDGGCVILCPHINFYYDEPYDPPIYNASIQCKVCKCEWSSSEIISAISE